MMIQWSWFNTLGDQVDMQKPWFVLQISIHVALKFPGVHAKKISAKCMVHIHDLCVSLSENIWYHKT